MRLSRLFPNLNPLPPWCKVFLWRRWSNRIETYNRGSRSWCSWTLSTWLVLLKPVFVLCVLWCCPELCIKHPLNPTPSSVGFTVRGRKRHMHTDTHRAPPPPQLVLSLCTNMLCMKKEHSAQRCGTLSWGWSCSTESDALPASVSRGGADMWTEEGWRFLHGSAASKWDAWQERRQPLFICWKNTLDN